MEILVVCSMKFLLFCGAIFGFVSAVPKACLILTDESSIDGFRKSYSTFLKKSGENCDSVDVRNFNDKSLILSEFGKYMYSDIVMSVSDPSGFAFARESAGEAYEVTDQYRQTTIEMHAYMAHASQEMKRYSSGVGAGIGPEDLLDFIDNGNRNVLVMVQAAKSGSRGISNQLEKFLKNLGFGISVDAKVIDPFRKETSVVESSAPLATEPWSAFIAGKKSVKYIGHPIGLSVENDRIIPVLRASSTSFAEGVDFSSQGLSLVLGGAHQTLNGARITLVGSREVFSDKLENSDFVSSIISWTFGNRGILRLSEFVHHRVGESAAPRMYREKDDVQVAVKFEELIGRNKWVPYKADDIQLEYVMLDPHVRAFMKYDPSTKRHQLDFKIPDVYGIFKFKIAYSRLGYNPIKFEEVAPVRNFRHNDYERFLLCAYPYYASSFVSLVLVAVFAAYFINHKEPKTMRHRE